MTGLPASTHPHSIYSSKSKRKRLRNDSYATGSTPSLAGKMSGHRWSNLCSFLTGFFLKFLTKSFERIPFLDLGGKKCQNPYEPGKGWSYITTQMNKMEFLPFCCLHEAQISSFLIKIYSKKIKTI
jgi:hypothetical protein